MKVLTKVKIERLKTNLRRLWNEVKDLMLAFIMLNMLINQLQTIDIFEPKIVTIKNEIIQEVEAEEIEEIEEIEKVKYLTAEFSAYNAEVGQTDLDPFTMASGKKVYKGAIACPRDMELGTKIEVVGYGEYICEDRLNIRYTNNFDIYMETRAEALKFGRRNLNYIIK